MTTTIRVSTETPGAEIWSRDGLMVCAELEFHAHDDDTASIQARGDDCVVERAGVFDIPANAMDKLCLDWLRERGLLAQACMAWFAQRGLLPTVAPSGQDSRTTTLTTQTEA